MEECKLRHPALAKMISVLLAVLCIVMIGFGVVNKREASADREKGLRAAENLAAKREKYVELDKELAEDPLNYEAATAELEKLIEQYKKASDEHKAKLAEFSATKGGTYKGSLALDEAAVALKAGKKQYEDGVEEMKKQLGEFAYILESPPTQEQIKYAAMAVEGAKAQADMLLEKVNGLQSKLDELSEQGISETALAELRETLTSLNEEKSFQESEETRLQELFDAGKARLEEAEAAAAAYISELSGLSEEELAAEAEAYIVQQTGKTSEELRTEADGYETQLQEVKNRITELTTMITETEGQAEEMAAVLGEIQTAMTAAKAGYEAAAAGYASAKELYEQLLMAVQAIEMLNAAKKAILKGEAEIGDAWYTLKLTKDGFPETQRELLSDKSELENEQTVISEMEEKIDSYDDITNRWKRAKTALLLYPDIKSRVEDGEDIAESAQTVSLTMKNNTEREYNGQLAIAILCIAAGVFGLMALPAAFEKMRTYPAIMVFTVLCLLCAAGAECVGIYMDLEQPYAALAGALFALMLIPAALPEKKRGT